MTASVVVNQPRVTLAAHTHAGNAQAFSSPRIPIRVKFTDATRQAKIALGGCASVKLQAEYAATPAVQFRFKFGTFNQNADTANDMPVRSDAVDQQVYAVPSTFTPNVTTPFTQPQQYLIVSVDSSLPAPTSASPIYLNVMLG